MFNHLHLHTENSLLDGAGKPSDIAKKATELGMTSIAITDHNHVGGWIDFKKACEDNNIKPILGCEMYQTYDTNILRLTADERNDLAIENYEKATGEKIPTKINKKKITKKQIKEIIKDYVYDTKQFHLVILAKNQTGLNNLIKLQSEASDKCTYNSRFCCDFEMLEKYKDGLIVLSACLGGMIPQAILKGNAKEARELAIKYKNIFKDDFYIEIQPLDIPEQRLVNIELIKIAKEFNIEIVATNDVHYVNKDDCDDHDTLLCVGTGKLKSDQYRMRYEHEFWIKDEQEMIDGFDRHTSISKEDIERAINNTQIISNKIENNLKLGSDKPLFPKVYVPKNLTSEQYLSLKSYKKLYEYKKEKPEINLIKYQKRLAEELDIINSKGFAPYMLKVFENIEFCEENDIPVGPGRGSAAGSLCLYLNGGTKVVDPIKYDLLFFRFLTKDRVDPPDIDSDFGYYGRDALIQHLEQTHGYNCVSHIGTYTVFGVKSGLKDFGRVLNYDFGAMNTLSKKIDEITDEVPGFKFKDFLQIEKDAQDALEAGNEVLHAKLTKKWEEYNKLEKQFPELFRLARKFEGVPRNMGIHASGILVTPNDINNYFPTRNVDGLKVCLYTGPQIESLNGIKLDILGLKTLDVLNKTIKSIDPKMTVNDLYKIIEQNLDNKEMFEMVQNKETEGLFQIESDLFKGMVSDILPVHLNDITAITSLGRPGPLQAGMHTQYGNRKNGHEAPKEQLRGTANITKDTFNTIIYQEQCMLIAKQVAGFDDAQSDSLCRKPLAKKKEALMQIFRKCFIYGKKNCEPPQNYDESNINQPFYDPKGKYGEEIAGGLNSGYLLEELEDFYVKLKGYASYLFNKSHAASYSILTLCTMYLKKFHTAKFFAGLLSMQNKEEKISLYSNIARKYNINVLAPNINISDSDFKEINGDIYYGLRSIKGVGESSLYEIVAKAPYASLEDCFEKLPKKILNKRVIIALAKSGALDTFEKNRYKMINNIYDIRKDKDDRYNENLYNKDVTIKLENEVLGTSLTHIPWWNTVMENTVVSNNFEIVNVTKKIDKNGNNMAFLELKNEEVLIKAIAFSKTYTKNQLILSRDNNIINIEGKKDNKNCLIISNAKLSA